MLGNVRCVQEENANQSMACLYISGFNKGTLQNPPQRNSSHLFLIFLEQAGDKPADALVTIIFSVSEFRVFRLLLAGILSV